MGKTNITKQLEKEIWSVTVNQGTFGCFEVTIGWYGKKRVDFMTISVKDIFKFYEIKVSKSDFYSKADNTFLGHYNYYVFPEGLYEQVKKDIPHHIGVYVGKNLVKRAKKQELKEDSHLLKSSMIRSLCRDVNKQMKNKNPLKIQSLNDEINNQKRNVNYYKDLYEKLENKLFLIENPQLYKNGIEVEITPFYDGNITRKGVIKGYNRNGYNILYNGRKRPCYVDEERIKIIK